MPRSSRFGNSGCCQSSEVFLPAAAARLAVLWDATIGTVQFGATETAARPSGVTLESFPIRNVEDIKDAIERAARERVHGLVVLTSPLIFNQRSQIADLALKTRLPTISLFN